MAHKVPHKVAHSQWSDKERAVVISAVGATDGATDFFQYIQKSMGTQDLRTVLAYLTFIRNEKLREKGILSQPLLDELNKLGALEKVAKKATRVPVSVFASVPVGSSKTEDLLEDVDLGMVEPPITEVGTPVVMPVRKLATYPFPSGGKFPLSVHKDVVGVFHLSLEDAGKLMGILHGLTERSDATQGTVSVTRVVFTYLYDRVVERVGDGTPILAKITAAAQETRAWRHAQKAGDSGVVQPDAVAPVTVAPAVPAPSVVSVPAGDTLIRVIARMEQIRRAYAESQGWPSDDAVLCLCMKGPRSWVAYLTGVSLHRAIQCPQKAGATVADTLDGSLTKLIQHVRKEIEDRSPTLRQLRDLAT